MTAVSLVGVASFMPERIVDNDFFRAARRAHHDGEIASGGQMFHGPKLRRHVKDGEGPVEMIARATQTLRERIDMRPARDIELILTNVTCLDIPFAGCGAAVAHEIGATPSFIVDLHNSGCVSFVYMMALARSLMASTGAKTALLCNVQNAAGRVFGQEGNRHRAQAAIPGDGCGVGYLVANSESPVRSVITRSYGEWANDMRVVNEAGNSWWEPHSTSFYIDFTEERIGEVFRRGNALVPAIVRDACTAAEITPAQIGVLVTNQPNTIFLRNWREALEVPKERHVETFGEYGNLFGAAIPVDIERALTDGKLKRGDYLALGGFSHAGDYAAAAIVHWFPN